MGPSLTQPAGLEWRAPAAGDLARVYDMMIAAYRAADPAFPADPGVFARYTECDPHLRAEDWVVGWIAGEPVTALRIFARDLVTAPGASLRLAGIGNVATHPAHGGKGLGSALLDRTLAVLAARGFDASLLYASRHGFYQRAGWAPRRDPWTRLALRRPLAAEVGAAAPGEGGMSPAAWGGGHAHPTRIVEAAGDDAPLALERAQELYARSYSGLPGSILRSDRYWQHWIGRFALAETRARLLVALRGATPVAYLAGRSTDDGLEILEGFAATSDGPALLGLAASLAGEATAIRWPGVPWLDAVFGSLYGRAEGVTRDGGMERVLREGVVLPAGGYLLSHLDRF